MLTIKCSEMENINISFEFFSSIKIITEELIKYMKCYKQISMEHFKQLKLFDNNMNIKLEDARLSQLVNLIYKIKEVIKQNVESLKCSIDDMNIYINDLENNLKEKTDIVNDLKKNSSNITNNLISSYQEVNKTGNVFISSLSKTEDIIDNYYINKIKIRDHENGLGNKLDINEYNTIKEQQKFQVNEMNNAIKLTKKYEEFHKGAIRASNKLYDEFIEESSLYKNKIKENVCQISQQIKENIMFFFVSFKSVYHQPLNLVENFIKEFNNLDMIKAMDIIIEQNLETNNLLKKSEPIRYKLKSLQFLEDINYIKSENDINDNSINDETMNMEINFNDPISTNRKAVKALDDDFCKKIIRLSCSFNKLIRSVISSSINSFLFVFSFEFIFSIIFIIYL